MTMENKEKCNNVGLKFAVDCDCPNCQSGNSHCSDSSGSVMANCRGCKWSHCSGYAFWCGKKGAECTNGGVAKQEDCFTSQNAELDGESSSSSERMVINPKT